MRVSSKFRKLLREKCEQLIEGGINCFPKWLKGNMPAFKKGEHYQRYMVQPIMEDDDFKKLVLQRFDDPRVGGIVVVGGVGGLVAIDNDAVKVRKMEKEIIQVMKEYGHMVYMDRRVLLHPKTQLKGLHMILFIDKAIFNTHILRIEHRYNAEFTIKQHGLVTVYPSLRIENKELSVYLKLSSAEIVDAVFDERLEVLPRIIEAFGGKLIMQKIDYSQAQTGEYTGSPGQPWHGLQYREINSDNVFLFLKNYARIVRCPGLEAIVTALENEDVFPARYFIYSSIVYDTQHPRSTWTLIENCIGRILGEVGADDSAVLKVIDAFEKSQNKYKKKEGDVDHKTLRRNITVARRFKEFGHDRPGACVFRLLGLCPEETCGLTCWLKLKSTAAREALEKAVAFTLAKKLVEVESSA